MESIKHSIWQPKEENQRYRGALFTGVSRHWSPIPRTMLLYVGYQYGVFFLRPWTSLDANLITALRPAHPSPCLLLCAKEHVSVYIGWLVEEDQPSFTYPIYLSDSFTCAAFFVFLPWTKSAGFFPFFHFNCVLPLSHESANYLLHLSSCGLRENLPINAWKLIEVPFPWYWSSTWRGRFSFLLTAILVWPP